MAAKENYNCKVNLAGLKHTVQKMQGASGEIEVLVIPIEANNLYRGEKGLYLDLVAWGIEEPKYEDSHMLKQSLPKEVAEKQSKEEKYAMPIMGALRPFKGGGVASEAAVSESKPGDKLPW